MRATLALIVVGAVVALKPAPTRVQAAADRRSFGRHLSGLVGAAGLAGLGAAAPAVAEVKVDPSAVQTLPSGAKFVITKEGSCPVADPLGLAGSCKPKLGSFAIVDFTGFLPDGQVFDTTEKKGGKALVFEFGANQVIPGIEQVVGNMRPGEEVQALIPADLAYGDKGVCTDEGCLIKPNTNLKYFLRLKRIAASAG